MSTAGRSSFRRLWFDVGLATVVPTVQLAILGGRGIFFPWSGAAMLTVALVLVQGLPLAARRYRPWLVFGVVLAANTVYYAVGLPPSGYDLGLAIALFTMANLRPIRASLLAYGLIVAETLVMKLLAVGPYWGQAPWFLVTYLWVYFGAAWLLGRYLRVRGQQTASLVSTLERERQESLAAAVRDERTRIARELHDVIAHHLSLMVIQAGGARRLVEQDPGRAKEALQVIEEYGRRGLEAMPGLLRALRTDGPEDRRPTPTLADVESLTVELRQTGLPVTVQVRGERRPLPDRVELSAFRIVQEALTNVIRHADRAPAEVELSYEPGRLVVQVSDEGPGTGAAVPRASGGHGIAGMRERVALLGGGADGGSAARRRFPGAGFDPKCSMIKILLGDDQMLVRTGLRMILDGEPDLEVVGEAGDGAAAVRETERRPVDVVLMDIRMPGTDGIEATRRITARGDGAPQRVGADHLRRGRVRVRGPAGRRGRVPAETHLAGAAGSSGARRGRRRGADCAVGNPPAHLGVRPHGPATGERGARRARQFDRAGARGPWPVGEWSEQRRDRRCAGGLRGDGQDPCRPRPDQAGVTGSGAGRDLRVRARPGPAVS